MRFSFLLTRTALLALLTLVPAGGCGIVVVHGEHQTVVGGYLFKDPHLENLKYHYHEPTPNGIKYETLGVADYQSITKITGAEFGTFFVAALRAALALP